MVMLDEERRYVGGAFIALDHKMRELPMGAGA